MRYIPLRKSIFDRIYSSYDLARYCGDHDRDTFGPVHMPDDVTDLWVDEEVVLFTPGRQQDGKLRLLTARILHVDPVTIRVTGTGT